MFVYNVLQPWLRGLLKSLIFVESLCTRMMCIENKKFIQIKEISSVIVVIDILVDVPVKLKFKYR